jgi:hypothetical protein
MVRDLGQTRWLREVERISLSHQKPTTKMISLLNLTDHQTGQTGFAKTAREELKPRDKLNLPTNRSPDSPYGLQREFGDAWVTSWITSSSKEFHRNALNHGEL